MPFEVLCVILDQTKVEVAIEDVKAYALPLVSEDICKETRSFLSQGDSQWGQNIYVIAHKATSHLISIII